MATNLWILKVRIAMSDFNRQRLLWTTFFLILLCFSVWHCYKDYKSKRELATTKQAVISSQASVDRAKSQYVTVKERNIQNEQTIAKNTVKTLYCEQYSNDADILIGFAELVQRAKEYNARQLNDSAGIGARP